MKVPGRKALKSSVRWVKSRFCQGVMVLGYHRIADHPQDPFALQVSPRNFTEHLESLKAYAYPISLKVLSQRLRRRDLPKRTIAVTFDDGYVDNLYQARPLLQDYEIPATVFVTSGLLGGVREFWWDELERVFLHDRQLPKALVLRIQGREHHWNLTEAGDLTSYPDWHFMNSEAPTQRHGLLQSLYQLLKFLSHQERQATMDQLLEWAGQPLTARPTHRVLKAEELVSLSRESHIEIGAHSVNHPFLGQMPEAEQRLEIEQSKKTLETILGRAVDSFSYPNGSCTVQTLSLVKRAGYHVGCASGGELVWNSSDPFKVPRFWVPNWDGKTFSRWLKLWLN